MDDQKSINITMHSFLKLLLFASLPLCVFASDLDSLLAVQRTRAGVRADTLFSALEKAKPEELADAKFLLAYMPLADLAYMTGDDILENVRLAQDARGEFSWGTQLTDELYQHFVLPHRVSQEPFVHWRDQFHVTLAPRVQHMTMTEAALEVNHWCHEVATYKPSDSRDQDPLTTIRAGLGRCEEEMILAICALRSVGIPARQCYTPFWPHMDDNHAWVEVWADGQWHYFGACEPDVVLDQAWFTNAAARAMLVVSTAYGDYQGPEPVLKRYGGSTLINSTAVYGTARELNVTLLDTKGKPAPKQKLYFNLYNYGCLLPALALDTDENGQVKLVCGPGDWFISSGMVAAHGSAILAHVKGNESNVTLRLAKTKDLRNFTTADYVPPPEAPAKDGNKADSLFACRLTKEDSLRQGFWTVWAKEAGEVPQLEEPDSIRVYDFAKKRDLDGAKLYDIFQKARGNWGNLFHFLTSRYPSTDGLTNADLPERLSLLETLSEKDCRDFQFQTLEDHYSARSESPAGIDSATAADCILCPRLSYEPSRPWRTKLHIFRDEHPEFEKDVDFRSWLLSNITVEEQKDRLGPPLTPAECLELRRGFQDDLERLYLGFMRVNGVPARFNPATMKPEIWEKDKWQIVSLDPLGNRLRPAAKQKPPKTGKLIVTADSTLQATPYNKTWGVQSWDKDHFSDLDLGYTEPFSKLEWPQELPAGLYCLTTGARRKDGSAPVAFTWFEIKPGKTSSVELNMCDNGETGVK
jgi:transglutaminase-like putative cysteine protease